LSTRLDPKTFPSVCPKCGDDMDYIERDCAESYSCLNCGYVHAVRAVEEAGWTAWHRPGSGEPVVTVEKEYEEKKNDPDY